MSKPAVIMTVDGVLRKLVGGAPIPEGQILYTALSSVADLLLLSDEYEKDTHEELNQWLMLHGYNSHSNIYFRKEQDFEGMLQPEQIRCRQVSRIRSLGYNLSMVIEPDAANAAELYTQGFNVMHFLHYQYAHPSWRPDYEFQPRPWDDIAHQVARQAELKAQDKRMESEST